MRRITIAADQAGRPLALDLAPTRWCEFRDIHRGSHLWLTLSTSIELAAGQLTAQARCRAPRAVR
jgi:hypothetical protein